MKRIVLLLLSVMVLMAVNAQPVKRCNPLPKPDYKEMMGKTHHAIQAQHVDFKQSTQFNAPKAAGAVVTPPEGLETSKFTMNGYMFDGSSWQVMSRAITIGFDGDDVYLQGFSVYLPEAWIKGVFSPDHSTISFPRQYYGNIYGEDLYFYPVTIADGEYVVIDAVFNYNEETNTLLLSQDVVCYILENAYEDEIGWYIQYDSEISIVPSGDVVEIPDGLETQEYMLTGYYMGVTDNNEWYAGDPLLGSAQVGFDGDDIYVQGLCSYLPKAWVKGHREGDSYVFENGQFFGTFVFYGEGYPLYFVGCVPETNDMAELVLTLDPETGALVAQQWYALSSTGDDVMWYDLLGDVVLTPLADEPAVPADPMVLYYEYYADDGMGFLMLDVPATDVDGAPLMTSKLGYQIFCDYGNGPEPYIFEADIYGFDEDLTTIAYTFNDDINIMAAGELLVIYNIGDDIQRIGVRSVYEGGGETNYSEIGWYDINSKVVITPPEGAESVTYSYTALDMQWGEEYAEEYATEVQVIFDGDDVYIQGLSKWIPEAWVKGTMTEDGTVVFPPHFLGYFTGWGVEMEFTFNGATFEFDPETSTFTSAEGYSTTSAYDFYGEHVEEDGDVFADVVITLASEVAATPAAPEILDFMDDGYGYLLSLYIPLEDVDGNSIFASMLSYQLFCMIDGNEIPIVLEADRYEYVTEDLSIIPYLYTDYWEIMQGGEMLYVYADDIDTWDAIGVKSIYTAGGETRESTITWWPLKNTGVTDITADDNKPLQYYDLMGRRVDANKLTPGIYVRSDGRKIIVR